MTKEKSSLNSLKSHFSNWWSILCSLLDRQYFPKVHELWGNAGILGLVENCLELRGYTNWSRLFFQMDNKVADRWIDDEVQDLLNLYVGDDI